MIDDLLLLSGNDLPFPEARLTIHQPRIKEIAYITEECFWHGCEFLKFNKEILSDQDKIDLSNRSNFNIIMMMMQQRNLDAQKAKLNIISLFALLFPTSEILLGKNVIQIRNHQTGQTSEINEQNFDVFKQILIKMFCLTNKENKQYNPSGGLAQKIANQFKKGQQKRAQLAPEKKIAIFSRYISILAVGQKKDINDLLNYTVYQLMDEFNRFELKLHYDTWEKYRIAGATGLQDPEDWLKDIHQD